MGQMKTLLSFFLAEFKLHTVLQGHLRGSSCIQVEEGRAGWHWRPPRPGREAHRSSAQIRKIPGTVEPSWTGE